MVHYLVYPSSTCVLIIMKFCVFCSIYLSLLLSQGAPGKNLALPTHGLMAILLPLARLDQMRPHWSPLAMVRKRDEGTVQACLYGRNHTYMIHIVNFTHAVVNVCTLTTTGLYICTYIHVAACTFVCGKK